MADIDMDLNMQLAAMSMTAQQMAMMDPMAMAQMASAVVPGMPGYMPPMAPYGMVYDGQMMYVDPAVAVAPEMTGPIEANGVTWYTNNIMMDGQYPTQAYDYTTSAPYAPTYSAPAVPATNNRTTSTVSPSTSLANVPAQSGSGSGSGRTSSVSPSTSLSNVSAPLDAKAKSFNPVANPMANPVANSEMQATSSPAAPAAPAAPATPATPSMEDQGQ
jgi:hypothetical protein